MVQPPGKVVEFMTTLSEEEDAPAFEVMTSLLVGQQRYR
jgi:hypothetical protein